ncbi:MAG: nucleoside hydrolase [Peptostreptococcaceae bacterium]
MKKIIFDCDNTMGIYGCDVDDGLTLLYLLGRDDIELLGVTTTYGNNKLDAVYDNTKNIFNELNINHIPLLKGCDNKFNTCSEACEYLVDMVNKYPNDITILATGSLTNLLGAYKLDNNFFDKVKEIVLMGGITEPLLINNKIMDELNFSCDANATHLVFNSKAKVTVLNAHICLQAFFGEKEFDKLTSDDLPIYRYIKDKTYEWFKFIMNQYGTKGFHNWDIVASVYITNPELFENRFIDIESSVNDFEIGMIVFDENNKSNINMPSLIKNVNVFNKIIFDTWENINI